MKKIFTAVTIGFIFTALTLCADTTNPWETEFPAIMKRIIPPKFQDKDFNIINYGAKTDGVSDSTEAIAKTIEACNQAGGGRVVIPEGIFITGAIHLKSNVNFYVSKGATLKFSQDLTKYPTVLTRFEGVECMNYSPFIYAYGKENIAITGEGTLDGQADSTHWWNWKKEGDSDRKLLFSLSSSGTPVEKRIFGEGHQLRTNFIQPYNCKNVLIEGVTIINSPMWEINPVLCTNVAVKNVVINSHGPNNDGCDPESSTDVLIKDCSFSTGDDCIAIKSGRNEDGRRIAKACENIVIQGIKCIDGHGAITMGSECSGDIRNIFAEDCELNSPNLDIAIRLKTNFVRGGIMENLHFRNITVGQVGTAVIHATMNYEEGDKGDFVPVIRNIDVTNLTSQKSKYAYFLDGNAKSFIDNVILKDCDFKGVTNAPPYEVNYVTKLALSDVKINDKPQVSMVFPAVPPVVIPHNNSQDTSAIDPKEFGAKADGISDDSTAIQQAIDKCAKNNGGIVVLKDGNYLSAPLVLKTGVYLKIEAPTLLKALPYDKYPNNAAPQNFIIVVLEKPCFSDFC